MQLLLEAFWGQKEYSELLIACESCHKDDACGHVREPLDFSHTTFAVQYCEVCEENIAPGTFWAASLQGRDPQKSLCVACGDTPAGLACRAELPYQLRHVNDFRGVNQALGLGTLDNWIDDIDTYNEYLRHGLAEC